MTETVDVRRRVLEANEAAARLLRERFAGRTLVPNLISSPGSGKTTLLERTLDDLGHEIRIATVTGDVQTQNDADRLARHTSQLVQAVVTNGACHLDARQVLTSLEAVDLDATDLLFIENVGNLVCPASWDLGESAKVVVFSVTEGEDKPLKYPKMFRMADAVVINKIDLLPYVPFDMALAEKYLREVNPAITILRTSALTGEGMETWYGYLLERMASARAR